MDDASAFLGTPADPNYPQNSRNSAPEWAPSSFDVRHRLTLSYIIDLPGDNRWTRSMQIRRHHRRPQRPAVYAAPSLRQQQHRQHRRQHRRVRPPEPDRRSGAVEPDARTRGSTPAPSRSRRRTRSGTPAATVCADPATRLRSRRVQGIAVRRASALTFGLQAFNLFNRTNFDLPEHFADEPATFGRIFRPRRRDKCSSSPASGSRSFSVPM